MKSKMMKLSPITSDGSVKVGIKTILSNYGTIPPYEEAPEFYIGQPATRKIINSKLVSVSVPEKVIALVSMKLEEADRLIYESGLNLERGEYQDSAELAFDAMIRAADGLSTTVGLQYIDDATTVNEFRTHFFEPGNFFPGYGAHIFKATEEDASTFDHGISAPPS